MRARDRCCKIAIAWLLLTWGAAVPAQEFALPIRDPLPDGADASGSGSDQGFPKTDELDALLDQDLSVLRRTTVAPALDVEVSTVSRQRSTIGRSPAAVYVVNQEMIRRSGARTVPELLRLVPGLHVANIDGSKWSISSRGFANRFANKLLVQIDGRTVYTPLFGGVFWDVQDLLLDDIKRIEVIRGPGATIWGANAVNGVINIITKSAAETHGAYALAGGGNVQQAFTGARIGGRSQRGVDWRMSGKWYERDSFVDPSGRADDGSQQGRIGFRTDWQTAACDQVTVQGDWYQGTNGLNHDRPIFGFSSGVEDVAGANILGRWTRTFSKDSDASLQFYYDRTDRIAAGFDQDTNTIDIDLQHRFSPWQNHRLIWGLQFRSVWDRLKNTQSPAFISVSDQRRTFERASAFVQDEIGLIQDKLYLTLGAKLSYNTYTDFEVQPSIRMLLLPTQDSAMWAAVSRAVRTPVRASEDIVLLGPALPSPPFPPNTPLSLVGNRGMGSEELIAYEIGYRRQQTENLSWDAAGFYNVYEDLHATRNVVPAVGLPFSEFFNGGSADVYGLEISSEWRVNCGWKIRAWYTYLKINSEYDSSANQVPGRDEFGTPVNQAMLMSSWNLGRRVECDLIARYVDAVRFAGIPSYISTDLRLAWRPTDMLEFSVVGQNLLDPSHREYVSNPFTNEIGTEVPRGVYGMATLRY